MHGRSSCGCPPDAGGGGVVWFWRGGVQRRTETRPRDSALGTGADAAPRAGVGGGGWRPGGKWTGRGICRERAFVRACVSVSVCCVRACVYGCERLCVRVRGVYHRPPLASLCVRRCARACRPLPRWRQGPTRYAPAHRTPHAPRTAQWARGRSAAHVGLWLKLCAHQVRLRAVRAGACGVQRAGDVRARAARASAACGACGCGGCCVRLRGACRCVRRAAHAARGARAAHSAGAGGCGCDACGVRVGAACGAEGG
jgi:hypothetical protein